MSFDLANFQAKLQALSGCLPAIAGLIQAVQIISPASAGAAKAALVVNTAIAVEPALAQLTSELGAIVSGVVNVLHASGQMPSPPPASQPTGA